MDKLSANAATASSDWRIKQALVKRILGQNVSVFLLSSGGAKCSGTLVFTSFDMTDVKDWAKLVPAIIGLANPIGAAKGLIGTSVQIHQEMSDVTARKPFSLQDIQGAKGVLTIYGASVAFGYEWARVEASNIFSVRISGATAGMMPFPQWGSTNGTWRVVESADYPLA